MPEGWCTSSAPDQPQVSAQVAWGSILVLLLISILAYLDRQIISLMVEPIKASLGISDFQIGLLQGVAFGLFYAAFGIPIGYLVDKYSRRNVIYIGVTIWSLAAAACGLANSFWQLLLARFGVGVGEASLSPAAYSMIADLFPPRRLSFALGVFAMGSSIGGAIAYAAGGALIGFLESLGELTIGGIITLEPWQAVFMIAGLPGVFIAMLMFLVPEPRRLYRKPPGIARFDSGVIAFLNSNRRYFICHFIGFGLIALLAYGTAAWAPAMLMRRYDLNVAHTGLLLGAVASHRACPASSWAG